MNFRPVLLLVLLMLPQAHAFAAIVEEAAGGFVSVGGELLGKAFRSQSSLESGTSQGEQSGVFSTNRSGFFVSLNNTPVAIQTESLIPSLQSPSVTYTYDELLAKTGATDIDGDRLVFLIAARVGSLIKQNQVISGAFVRPNESITWIAPPGEHFMNTVLHVIAHDGSDPALNGTAFMRTFAPAILSDPESGLHPAGEPLQLSVFAIGREPLSYQWAKDGAALAGATNALLNYTNLARLLIGEYSATVSNRFGLASSAKASIQTDVPEKVEPPKLLPNGKFQLTFGDFDGGTLSLADVAKYRVLWSTNLFEWHDLTAAFTVRDGKVVFEDPLEAAKLRFYKILNN